MPKKTLLTLTSFSLLLLVQPGFNTIQQYQIHVAQPLVRAAPVEVPTEATIPVAKTGTQLPSVTAQAAIVIDKESGTVMYEKNADTKLYPASITKMMTALVASEIYPLTEVLTVTEESEAIGSSIDLQRGEQMTVENLIKGLLVKSGNDAAYTLANLAPGGYDRFVELMNQKAKEWNMTNTTFTNVSGVEEEGHVTTVRDLATLEKIAMEHELFRNTVKLPRIQITDITGTITHDLESTNQLLGVVPGIEGVKTGFTNQAGECLVTQTTRDGHTIITVVLNSADRFGESQQLIEWAYRQYDWQNFSFSEAQ